jgi:hypothetical protein
MRIILDFLPGRSWVLPFLLLLLGGCGTEEPGDQSPSFRRADYAGGLFRMDGYYHHVFASDSNSVPVQRVRILFFYGNGVFLHGGAPTLSGLPQREEEFRNGGFYLEHKEDKSHWGVFRVEEMAIVDEGWVASGGTYAIVRETKEIIDDTTLILTGSERLDGSERRVLNETYRFQPFGPKPDSQAAFIR